MRLGVGQDLFECADGSGLIALSLVAQRQDGAALDRLPDPPVFDAGVKHGRKQRNGGGVSAEKIENLCAGAQGWRPEPDVVRQVGDRRVQLAFDLGQPAVDRRIRARSAPAAPRPGRHPWRPVPGRYMAGAWRNAARALSRSRAGVVNPAQLQVADVVGVAGGPVTGDLTRALRDLERLRQVVALVRELTLEGQQPAGVLPVGEPVLLGVVDALPIVLRGAVEPAPLRFDRADAQ